jgi:hypothetical protein
MNGKVRRETWRPSIDLRCVRHPLVDGGLSPKVRMAKCKTSADLSDTFCWPVFGQVAIGRDLFRCRFPWWG